MHRNPLLYIGQAIRERRKQLKYSQVNLADRVGVDPCIISYIENGRNFRISTLIPILQVLELELTLS
jgi:transcriptional regulator with XRE-family HTH domain